MADSQLGFGEESTYGTGVAVTRFLPFRSSSLDITRTQLDDPGIVAGQRTIRQSQLALGTGDVAGAVSWSVFQSDIAVLFKHALGGVSTAGAGPTYTHTITPSGAVDGLGLTIQEGIPDQGGTVNPFSYSGCKIQQLTLNVGQDDLTLEAQIVGQDWHTVADGGVYVLQTAAYPAGLTRFLPQHFTGQIDPDGVSGLASRCIRGFSLTIANNMDTDRYCLGTTIRKEPLLLPGRSLDITGTIDLEWDTIDDFDRFDAQTITSFEWTLDNGGAGDASRTITGTMDIETTGGAKPQVTANQTVYLSLGFRAVENTTPGDALTVVIVDDNAAP
jgi:hypothetical protein